MNFNPYDRDDVKEFNFKLGRVGEQIVHAEINRFDGYSTTKAEYKVPDYKIFINGELAGYAEVKVQKMRHIINNTHLGYSFKTSVIDKYRSFDTAKTPLEFYIVDPVAKCVFWDYFSELEREREVHGACFPFDEYAKAFREDMHHYSIEQFRYRFPISDKDADTLKKIIDERDDFISQIQRGEIDNLRSARMAAYENNAS